MITVDNRYRLKTDTDISINTDAYTDMVIADSNMIETDTYILVLAKNIVKPIYRSISTKINIMKSIMFLY